MRWMLLVLLVVLVLCALAILSGLSIGEVIQRVLDAVQSGG